MTDIADVYLRADSSEVKGATKDLNALDASAKKVDKSTADMGVQTGKANKALGNMASAAAGALGPLAAMAGAALGISNTLGTISDFGASMSQVGAISRATAEELAQMEAVAKQLGASTSFSASQVADGLKFLSQAGFTATESIAAIPDVLNLAKAAALDLGSAADIASNVMSGFGIEATRAGEAADILAAISSRANTNVQQLGEAASYVGPVAAAMGVSLGTASAAMGVLSDAGIQGSSAGTGLRRVLSSLANPTKEAAGVLQGLGLSLDEVNPATNDLTVIIDRLAATGIDAADALTIFGDRGGPAILALTAQNDRVRQLAIEMKNVTGEAARMSEEMGDNLDGDIRGLQSSVEALQLSIGEAGLGSSFRGLVQELTGFTRGLTEAVQMLTAFNAVVNESIGDSVFLSKVWSGLGNAMQAVVDPIAAMRGSFSQFQDTMEVISSKDVPAMERRLGMLSRDLEVSSKSAFKTEDGMNKLRKEIAMLEAAVEHFKPEETWMDDEFLGDITAAAAKLDKQTREYAQANRELGDATGDASEEMQRLEEDYRDVLEAIYPIKAEARAWGDAQQTLKSYLDAGNVSLEEYKAHTQALANEFLPEVTVQAERVTGKILEMEQQADPLAKAYERGVERMRDGFGDFFKDIITEGKFSFDGLLDLWKDTVAEMVATAASRQVLGAIGDWFPALGSLMGGSAGGGSGGGLGSLGNLGSIASSIGSLFNGGLSGMASSAWGGLTSLFGGGGASAGFASSSVSAAGYGAAVPAGASYATGGAGAAAGGFGSSAMAAAPWAALAVGIFNTVSDLADGLYSVGDVLTGDHLNQKYGDMFGGLGQVLFPSSKIVDPLGIVDSIFGGLGGKNRADKREGVVDLSTGAYTKGDNRGHDFDEVAEALAAEIGAFSQIVGGTGSIGFRAHGEHGFGFEGEGRDQGFGQDVDAFLAEAFDRVVESSKTLTDSLKGLIIGFDGTREETSVYAQSLIGISDLLAVNPIARAMEDFTVATDSASTTLYGAYMRNNSAISELIGNYDGSAAATQQLNVALAQGQEAAYQLALGIQQLKVASSDMFAASAQSIRESVMTEEERRAGWERERAMLEQSIGVATDPEALQRTLSQINELTNQIFGSIGDPTREQAEAAASYLDQIAAAGQQQYDRILANIEQAQLNQQDALNTALELNAARQEAAAAQQVNAANISAQAAATMLEAARAMLSLGGSGITNTEEIA